MRMALAFGFPPEEKENLIRETGKTENRLELTRLRYFFTIHSGELFSFETMPVESVSGTQVRLPLKNHYHSFPDLRPFISGILLTFIRIDGDRVPSMVTGYRNYKSIWLEI